MNNLRGEFLKNRNAYVAAGEPMIFHCHHYNTFLQASIESAKDYIDVYPILINSAQEVAYHQFTNHFAGKNLSVDEKKAIAQEWHQYCGYGTLDLSEVSENGGKVSSPWNHYVEGWLSKFGKRNENQTGVAYFSAGFAAGALDAIYDKPVGTFCVEQTSCKTKGAATNEFAVSFKNKTLEASPGEGKFQTFDFGNVDGNPVNYKGIRDALTGMEIAGNEDGAISAFGVMLTRMFGNYYALISYRYLKEMTKEIGEMGTEMAEELLTEAGHVCAFNTFGGIMESNEWNGLIKPMLRDRNDWVHGIVACLNALGWGKLEIAELVPNEKLVLRVYSGYENNCHQAKYGDSDRPKALFKIGATAGIMNLIYHGDILSTPELNETYYDKIFKTEGRFVGRQTVCRSNGGAYDEFVAERES